MFYFRKLIKNNRVRIVVYKNGIATEPVEVVADLNNLEDVSMLKILWSKGR